MKNPQTRVTELEKRLVSVMETHEQMLREKHALKRKIRDMELAQTQMETRLTDARVIEAKYNELFKANDELKQENRILKNLLSEVQK